MDIRFQQRQLQSMTLNGVPLAVRDKLTNELTIGGTELSIPATIALGAIALSGALCIAEEGICEDSDNKNDAANGDDGGNGNQNNNNNQNQQGQG